MSYMPPVSADASPELKAVYDEIVQSRGWLSNAMTALGHAPEGLRRFASLGDYCRHHTDLTEAERELVIVTIARASPYAATHHAAHLRRAGISERAVDAILAGRVPDDLSQGYQAIVRFALEFTTPASVSATTFEQLRKHLTERAITDVTLIAAYYLAAGTAQQALRVELEPPGARGRPRAAT